MPPVGPNASIGEGVPKTPPAGRPIGGIGGTIFRKSFVINITYVHCVHNVVLTSCLHLSRSGTLSCCCATENSCASLHPRCYASPHRHFDAVKGCFVTYWGF